MPDFTFGIYLAGVATALALVSCDKTPPPAPEAPAASATGALQAAPTQTGTVQVSGSSALQPLVNTAKDQFETSHKGASVEVSAGGSKKGLADVAAGAVQIGDSDIFAPADLKAKLVDHKVAVIGFAAMANKGPYNEKITGIGLAEMAKIFSGEAKNWKEVGGGNVPIVVINRAPGSGTRSVFGDVVLGGDKFVESQTEDNSGALVAKLKQTKGAISYLAMSFADPELQTFAIKGDAGVVDASAANITAGNYPIWSYEHMYTNGEAVGIAKDFIDYILSPAFQETVLPTVKGFIPVTQMKVSRDEK
jgi:phosphate transport system substrate-binding protein